MGEKGEKLKRLCVNCMRGMNSKRAKEILRETRGSQRDMCLLAFYFSQKVTKLTDLVNSLENVVVVQNL
jgi:hypothetical protein